MSSRAGPSGAGKVGVGGGKDPTPQPATMTAATNASSPGRQAPPVASRLVLSGRRKNAWLRRPIWVNLIAHRQFRLIAPFQSHSVQVLEFLAWSVTGAHHRTYHTVERTIPHPWVRRTTLRVTVQHPRGDVPIDTLRSIYPRRKSGPTSWRTDHCWRRFTNETTQTEYQSSIYH